MTWRAWMLVLAFASGATCGVLCVDAVQIVEARR
jgi:hypothetical protein